MVSGVVIGGLIVGGFSLMLVFCLIGCIRQTRQDHKNAMKAKEIKLMTMQQQEQREIQRQLEIEQQIQIELEIQRQFDRELLGQVQQHDEEEAVPAYATIYSSSETRQQTHNSGRDNSPGGTQHTPIDINSPAPSYY